MTKGTPVKRTLKVKTKSRNLFRCFGPLNSNTFQTNLYRKSTHPNRFLNFHSKHNQSWNHFGNHTENIKTKQNTS